MSPPLSAFARVPASLLPLTDSDLFVWRRSIAFITPANYTTDVAVGAPITVVFDASVVTVEAEGAIEVRHLHGACILRY